MNGDGVKTSLKSRTENRLYSFSLKFMCFSAVLCTFFEQYKSFIPGITLGELFLIIASLLRILTLRKRVKLKNTSHLVKYYFFGLFLTALSVLISQVRFTLVPEWEFASRLIRYLAIVIFYVLACDRVDKGFVLKIYRASCIIVSIYILLQPIVYLLFNVYLPIKVLPFFKFSREIDVQELLNSASSAYYRGCGVFAEPSYAARFLLPGLVFSLCGWFKKDKSDLFTTLLILFSIIITTSLQGIVIAFFTLIVFLITNAIKNNAKKRKISNWLFTFIAILGLVAVLYFRGRLDLPLERISGIKHAKVGSTSLRLYRGFVVWWKLPLLYKFIGVGFGNLANFIDTFNIRTVYDSYYTSVTAMEYVNGISSVLVHTGLLSAPFIIAWFVRLYKNSKVVGRTILFQLILILFSGSGIFTLTSLFHVFMLVVSNGAETTNQQAAATNQLIGENT